MSPSTDRQTFRETVALVAAKAKAKLPQAVNGRIESAVKLVLAHDVTFLDDGTVEVGSASDPLKTYILAGHACDCQDFSYGKAPDGWCQHRIAAGIAKRVQELLAAQRAPAPVVPDVVEPWPDNDPEEAPAPALPVAPLPEAPASVNVRVQIAGREVQWTLRDSDEARLALRLEALLARYPVPQPQPQGQLSPQQQNALAQGQTVTGVCPIHSVPMRWNEGKDGKRGWHSYRLQDGTWCKGR